MTTFAITHLNRSTSSTLAMLALSCVLLAGLASLLLGFFLRRVLGRNGVLLDVPNSRSSHSVPIVRGGGVAIMAALILGLALLGGGLEAHGAMMILAATFALAVVSFMDDVKSLGAILRLGCHVGAAVVAVQALGLSRIELAIGPDAGVVLPAMLSWLLGVLWITGYTNAFNFMDGINGIAAGQAVVTGLGMALLAFFASKGISAAPMWWSLVLAGAALGFMPHNFPKARMFMGDVGSVPLGFLLSVLALWLAKSVGWWLLIPLSLLHTNFILDTAITLLRRVARGEKWYAAHREHFYQRLIRAGKTHSFVSGVEMALQVLVLVLMLAYVQSSVPIRILLIFAVVGIWLAFFGYCEGQFRLHGKLQSGVASLSQADSRASEAGKIEASQV